MALRLLEKDIHEKQDSLIAVRGQLEEVKTINLQMYNKLEVSTFTVEVSASTLLEVICCRIWLLAAKFGYLLQNLVTCCRMWLFNAEIGYLLQNLVTCCRNWLFAAEFGYLLHNLVTCCRIWFLSFFFYFQKLMYLMKTGYSLIRFCIVTSGLCSHNFSIVPFMGH